MPTITLPTPDGLKPFTLSVPRAFPKATPPFPRLALAAAHIVADPLAEQDPWLDAKVAPRVLHAARGNAGLAMTAAVFSNKVVRRRAITFSVLLAVSFVLMAISSSPIVIELQKGVAFAFSPVQGWA